MSPKTLLLTMLLCAPVCGQGSGGSSNIRTTTYTNSQGGWATGAPACSCLVDPKVIQAPNDPGDNALLHLVSTNKVSWGGPDTDPIGGVTLAYYTPGLYWLDGIPVPLLYPVSNSTFIGDINDYLEEWTAGDCPAAQGGCPVRDPCWFRVSYTIVSDGPQGSHATFPIEWEAKSTGGLSETNTLDVGDPNKRQVDILMYCAPGCVGTPLRCEVNVDCGADSPQKLFQAIEVACTPCGQH